MYLLMFLPKKLLIFEGASTISSWNMDLGVREWIYKKVLLCNRMPLFII